MNLFRLIISPPHFDDEPEKTRHALLLHFGSVVLFVVPFFLILLNLLFGNQAERSINYLLAGLALLQIPVQIFIRNGQVRTATWILLVMSWVAMTWIASRVEGVGDVAQSASPVSEASHEVSVRMTRGVSPGGTSIASAAPGTNSFTGTCASASVWRAERSRRSLETWAD